ncbi:hypothetical protein QC758_19180 [Halomonas campisalis]|nr:hypothetical protein [Halomonas campisalis]MDR5865082.1 hypothetical protein [Halomonas campisalis]
MLYANREISSAEERHQVRQEQLEQLEALGVADLFLGRHGG